MGLSGLAGGPDLGFGFPWNGGIPRPHQQAPKREQRESGKACKPLSLNKSPRNFVPIELLCKHVTNQLKPATNCLCSPYKFMHQLGLVGFFWPGTTALVAAEALARVSNKLPFFCELHCLGSLLSFRLGIRTSGITDGLWIRCRAQELCSSWQFDSWSFSFLLEDQEIMAHISGNHQISTRVLSRVPSHMLSAHWTAIITRL